MGEQMNKMDEQGAILVVQGQLDAYNAHDLDAFCRWFSKDIRVWDGRTHTLRLQGQAEFRERYQQTLSNPKLYCTLLQRIVQGNIVIDHEDVLGIRSDAVRAIAIYQVENGEIVEVTFF